MSTCYRPCDAPLPTGRCIWCIFIIDSARVGGSGRSGWGAVDKNKGLVSGESVLFCFVFFPQLSGLPSHINIGSLLYMQASILYLQTKTLLLQQCANGIRSNDFCGNKGRKYTYVCVFLGAKICLSAVFCFARIQLYQREESVIQESILHLSPLKSATL